MPLIVREKDEDAPADYVRCTKEEALAYQDRLIKEWTPASDVWAFHYGLPILSFTSAISGGLITSYIRRRLHLKTMGAFAMFFPAVAVPAAFGPLFQQTLVSESVLLQNECPICLQVRSMLIQNGAGIAYPSFIASASGLMLAERYVTYRLPEFSFRVVPEFVKISVNILAHYRKKIAVIALVNSLIAGFITDRQSNAVYIMARKINDEKSN